MSAPDVAAVVADDMGGRLHAHLGSHPSVGMPDHVVFDSNYSSSIPMPTAGSEPVTELYFEVLVVLPPEESPRTFIEALAAQRKKNDEFYYVVVPVFSVQAAVAAVFLNTAIQAVVISHGVVFDTENDTWADSGLPLCSNDEVRRLGGMTSFTVALAQAIRQERPELDIYNLSKLNIESIASRFNLVRLVGCWDGWRD